MVNYLRNNCKNHFTDNYYYTCALVISGSFWNSGIINSCNFVSRFTF